MFSTTTADALGTPAPLPRREQDPSRERIGSWSEPAQDPAPVPSSIPAPVSIAPVAVEPTPAPDVRRLLGHALERLAVELPALRSALVCGADGIPLAAHGMAADEAAHLSVLASSLHAMCEATTRVHHGPGDAAAGQPVDFVTVASGDRHTVVLAVPAPSADHPLLAVTADGCSIGRILASARSTATYVGSLLQC